MNQELQNALIAKLQTVVGLPPLQKENTVLTRDSSQPVTRATFIYSRPATASIGLTGRNRHEGLMQVDLMYPSGQGTVAVNAMVDKVIAAFPRGTALDVVGIPTKVHVLKVYRETANDLDNGTHIVPVTVMWRLVHNAS